MAYNINNKIKEVEIDLEYKKAQQRRINREIDALIKKKNLLINTINPPLITISDHALIRYIERIAIMNIEDYKDSILTKYSNQIYKINGTGTVIDKGVKMICKEYNILTIINIESE